MMDDDRYCNAERWLKETIKESHEFFFDPDLFDDEMHKASGDLNFPYESLVSFLRNIHLTHIKKKSYIIKNKMQHYVDNYYVKGTSIVSLAKKVNYPPSMMARAILGLLYSDTSGNLRKSITEAMRDPINKLSLNAISREYIDSEKVKDDIDQDIVDSFSGSRIVQPGKDNGTTRLAREVLKAINADPLYGPHSDKARNLVGLEYEMILEEKLRLMNISIETEGQLRIKGTARTPDILLLNPVAIRVPLCSKSSLFQTKKTETTGKTIIDNEEDWKTISWIDSKVSSEPSAAMVTSNIIFP